MNVLRRIKPIIAQELPFACAAPAMLWVFLFLCVPVVMMIIMSLYAPDGTWWNMINFHRYKIFFDTPYVIILLRTIFLAGVTAFSCLFLGYPVAYYLAVCVQKWKPLLLFLLTLPFWTNFIIQVYAWFFLLEYNGLINMILLYFGIIDVPLNMAYTFGTVILVMIYCYFPYMVMPIYSTLQKLDKRLLEASMDLGATRWETFWRITFPLSLPGIKAGVLLVFVPAFGDFTVPSLVGGSRYFTIGSLIVYYFTVIREVAFGAALTCLSGFILLILSSIWHFCFITRTRRIRGENT